RTSRGNFQGTSEAKTSSVKQGRSFDPDTSPCTSNLVLLAQILRPKGPALGIELSPATDRPKLVDALSEVLDTSPVSSGRVVAFDVETVAPDLSAVPLDEVLDFRK